MVRRKLKLPLFALILLPSLVGVILMAAISWRLFDPAVERSSDVALTVLEDMIKTTGSESLRYPLAVGDNKAVERIVTAMASNDLVFAVQVEDAQGQLIARAQNNQLPIEEGIRLIEYREKLFIETLLDDEMLGDSVAEKTVYVGEALYQLTPHVMAVEKERLVREYQVMIGLLLMVGLTVILLATRVLWKSVVTIKSALQRISQGETDATIDSESYVSELDVIREGVNRLSENIDTARAQEDKARIALEEAVDKAQRSDRESRALYETATREIADPVIQLVELLKLNQQNAATPVDPGLILDSAERVRLSVLAILGKLDEDRTADSEHEIELGDYFDLLETRYRARFQVRELGFRIVAKGRAAHARYRVDVRALDIVLEKLIENAMKFTPEGEVRVIWSVQSDVGKNWLSIAVRDNGVGIGADHMSRVFERYFHVEHGDEMSPGSGLGLYIAKELLNLQGGEVSVNSQLGVGSEFVVRLPIEQSGQLERESTDVKGRIVLIVGANDRDRTFMEDQFSHREMVTLHADTAIEGLALLAEHQIDLIVIDANVSDIDVDSFVVEARKRQAKMLIGVISTGDDSTGVYDSVTTPVDKAALSKLLSKLVSPQSAGVDYGLINRLKARQGEDQN